MAPIQKTIEALGYTAKEAKVYIAALTLGECHISDIASRLKMPLSSAQTVVDKLHKSGLMNFYVRKRYKYWVAEGPEKILTQLRLQTEMITAVLPDLTALSKNGNSKVHALIVKVFNGRDEIKSILDDIIDTKQHVLAIMPEDSFLALFEGTSIPKDFIRVRAKHFLRVRMLVSNTPAGKELSKNSAKELREVRFLPNEVNIQTAMFIYGDKVANIIFNQKKPTAVLIDDPSIRETKEAMFEALWSLSAEN